PQQDRIPILRTRPHRERSRWRAVATVIGRRAPRSPMNEAPFPTQTTVPRSLAPPSMRGAPAPRVSRLRASLVACSGEGLVAEVVGACFGNAVVTAWGVELGASPLLFGALWGLPYFGQIFQLPGAWITSRFGRKRVAVVMNALARQALL